MTNRLEPHPAAVKGSGENTPSVDDAKRLRCDGSKAVTAGNAIHTSSAHEVAEAMRAIAANPRLRNTLRGCGLERAAAFSWARTARETRAVYEEVLQTVRSLTHPR